MADSPVFDTSVLPPDIRWEMGSQDNACTAEPFYVVYQKREIFNVTDDANDVQYYWRNVGSADTRDEPYHEHDPKKIKRLDAYFAKNYRPKPGWERDFYVEVPEFVTACFTRKAAQQYIDSNAHNLHKPYIFVESLYRNSEMVAVRKFLGGPNV